MNEENTSGSVDTTSATTTEVDSQGDGQATQVVQPSNEDSFFDPTKVPDELKPAYKQMQADYTKKTQEIAAIRKEHGELKAKADGFKRYEQFAPILEEMLSSQNKQTESPQMMALEQELRNKGYGQEAIELIKMGTQFTLNQFNQTQQQKEQARVQQETQVRLNNDIAAAEKLDPRLSDEKLVYTTTDGQSLNFGQIVSNLVMADPKWIQDPVSATKKAIATVDALIGKAKTEGKEELSNSARTKATRFPSNNSSPQSAVQNAQPTSMREAAEMARKELNA